MYAWLGTSELDFRLQNFTPTGQPGFSNSINSLCRLLVQNREQNKISSFYVCVSLSLVPALSTCMISHICRHLLEACALHQTIIDNTPKIKSYGLHSFSNQGSSTWNSLPFVLRSKETMVIF